MFSRLTALYIFIKIKIIASQYYNMPQQYFQMPMQYYESELQSQDPSAYDAPEYGSPRAMPDRYNTNNQYNRQDCDCSCDQCKQPKPCCYFACYSCPSTPSPTQANANQNQFIFVPYPYPLTIPFPTKNDSITSSLVPSTTMKTTTPDCVTSVKFKSYRSSDEIIALRNSVLLNSVSKRRTRPAWVPKYGIVPIPDQLAAKLMSQLRDDKTMQARRLK